MGRNKEQAAKMLDRLVVNAPRVIGPYMEPMLKVLVPKLRDQDSNPGIIVSVLRCVGDLAEVSLWPLILLSQRFVCSNTGSCHKRQKPQAPTPQASIRNRQTRKVANAKGLNRNTNLT